MNIWICLGTPVLCVGMIVAGVVVIVRTLKNDSSLYVEKKADETDE